jgi:orotate phosphoribosyltransferase
MRIDLLKLLDKKNVIKNGHFKLTSGRHSDTYINKDSIFCIPELFELIILEMSLNIRNSFQFDIITGPAIAGAVLAAPIANSLGTIFIYPEKIDLYAFDYEIEDTVMEFRRGYDKVLENNVKVVIVEDIITTGKSINMTIEAIEKHGAQVSGIVAIWNRTGWKTDKCSTISLIDKPVESWEPESCPLCVEGIPLQNPKEL